MNSMPQDIGHQIAPTFGAENFDSDSNVDFDFEDQRGVLPVPGSFR